MSGMRSHTRETLIAAQAAGKSLYALETGADGMDDILIAEPGDGPVELWSAVGHWLDEPAPPHWTLRKVDWEL